MIQADPVGIAGFVSGLAAKTARRRRWILPLQFVSYVCWGVYLFLSGAVAATALNALSASVTLLGFLMLDASGRIREMIVRIAWITGAVVVAILYRDPSDLLLFPALSLQYAALLAGSGKQFRIRILLSALIWLGYNLLAGLVIATVSAVVNSLILLFSIYRYDTRGGEDGYRIRVVRVED